MKLLSFDIDGTLMPKGHDKIPLEVVEALNLLVDKGDMIIFNSGRPLKALQDFAKPVHKGKIFFSICNGAALYDIDGNEIFTSSIPYSYLKHFYLANPNLAVFAYTDKNDVIYFKESSFANFEAKINGQSQKLLSLDEEMNDTMYKILLCEKEELLDKAVIEYDASLFKIMRTWPHMIELQGKDIDKDLAIKILQDKFDIPSEDIYAFGDADNDYLALERYQSATFENGSAKCKEAATYVSPYYESVGLLDALKHFHII